MRRILIIAFVLLAGVSVTTAESPAQESDSGFARLLVYLDVEDAPEARITLAAASLVLAGPASRPVPVAGAMTLDSRELGGRQILLAETSVPPGQYTELRLELSGVSGMAGVAPVTVDFPHDGLVLPLALTLEPRSGGAVFLRWNPHFLSLDTKFHAPDVHVERPDVPPLGRLTFVTLGPAGVVVLIDRGSGRVVGAIPVGADPRDIVYFPGDRRLFVALAGDDAIAVIDALALRVERRIPLNFGDKPTRLLLGQDRSSLFVLGAGSRTVTALTTWSLQQVFRSPVEEGPVALAQDPLTGAVYVSCETAGKVQILDPDRGGAVRDLAELPGPGEMIVDEGRRRLYVASLVQRSVQAFDLGGGRAAGPLNLCGSVTGLALDPRSDRLYAAIPSCREIAILGPARDLEFAALKLDHRCGLLAFDPDLRRLIAVLPDDERIAVLNPRDGSQKILVHVGQGPFAAVSP